MNAPTTIPVPLTIEEAHLLRSRLIEKCAAFEARLYLVAARAGTAISQKAPLGQKVEALQSALQSKQSLEKHDKRISSILERALPLMALRNELAHGTMQLATIEQESVLLISNAVRVTEPIDLRCLVRKPQLVDAARDFASLSNQLAQILNPPSPPQPKPVATTGP